MSTASAPSSAPVPASSVPASPAAPPPWHAMPAEAVVAALGTHPHDGLASAEAARRLTRDGPNLLTEGARRGPLHILLAQFADFTVAVLAAAAVLAGALGEPGDMVAILAILAVNAVLGFVQEYRAERAAAALKDLAAPRARVRRDGASHTIAAAGLASGDVVRLEAGDMVAADLRLVEVADLRIAEATLTGESEAVAKQVLPVADSARLGDRRSMAYKGTVVARGRAVGVVIATGMRTELGRIATMLAEVEVPRTPLQQRLTRFTRRLALAVLAICAVLFLAGVLRGEPAGLMLLTALSLAVAAIPEALPAVVTVALALGARRAAVRHALIRRLPAVETLGSVTYICSDKTGTLTENRMRVVAVRTAASLDADLPLTAALPRDLLLAMALSNDAEVAADGTCTGDPTEVALLEAARSAGVEKAAVSPTLPRVAELPFTSARGRMTTVHAGPAGVVAFTKGAPEVVIDRCVRVADGPLPGGDLTAMRVGLHAAAERLASEGMRVLAIAMRALPSAPDPYAVPDVEEALTFLGLVGLLDPPRADAAAAVAECRGAGIKVVMVTGDHPATARAVAARLGITDGVHARVTPEEKIGIVEALQARGEFVAMTGDGVNDAPALKRANIGIAMGRTGTDVAREASDLILLDDHFATIVGAVREGRRIYDNIRKFVRYALTCNSAEIWTLVLAPLVGLPIPLLPIHLLWINLVTDGLPGVALGVEPGERALMRRPPRAPDESILARGLWQHAVWVGLLMGGATLATQAWTWSHDAQGPWQSMTFTVLAFLQVGHLLAIRSERDAFHVGFWRNPALLAAVALTIALQLAALYLPLLNRLLRTEPLTLRELGVCVLVSTAGFVAVELEKAAVRRGWLWRDGGAGAPGASSPEVG